MRKEKTNKVKYDKIKQSLTHKNWINKHKEGSPREGKRNRDPLVHSLRYSTEQEAKIYT